jgi:glutamine cyclotransferase
MLHPRRAMETDDIRGNSDYSQDVAALLDVILSPAEFGRIYRLPRSYRLLKKIIIFLGFILVSVAFVCLFKLPGDLDSHPRNRRERPLFSDEAPDRISYKIIKVYPHSPDAFTQGLFYKDGFLYESTGQYGLSSLRKVRLETGEVLRKIKLPGDVFGEGIAPYEDQIIQLTWYANRIYIYKTESFELIDRVRSPQRLEGWGLTFDGNHLIWSDGSSLLYFLDPVNFHVQKKVEVHTSQGPLNNINELEYIKGSILANVWQSNLIVVIDPDTGRITGFLDLSELDPKKLRKHPDYVLNGIAFNAQNGHIYVTGKMWPKLYEIELNRIK